MRLKLWLRRENIRNLFFSPCSGVREILYPRRCPVCRDIVVPKGRKICPDCRKKLSYISEPFCRKCGKPLETEEQEYCFDCMRKKFSYEWGRALFLYDSQMKESIADFKFRGKKEYADFFAEEIGIHLKEDILAMQPDAIVPVPMFYRKQKIRGYNQAELIARGIGRRLELPVIDNFLIRNKNTLPQKKLDDKERFKNLAKAFEINKDVPVICHNIKSVLLVDDIYTTGSTIEACARVLLSYGIEKIYFISLSIGKGC